ncbi:uncharacterized protein LOC102803655 isoform X2 [Saccoglossus kowalevskii]
MHFSLVFMLIALMFVIADGASRDCATVCNGECRASCQSNQTQKQWCKRSCSGDDVCCTPPAGDDCVADVGGTCRAKKCNRDENEVAGTGCRNGRVCCVPEPDCVDDLGGTCRAKKCNRDENEVPGSGCRNGRVCCIPEVYIE